MSAMMERLTEEAEAYPRLPAEIVEFLAARFPGSSGLLISVGLREILQNRLETLRRIDRRKGTHEADDFLVDLQTQRLICADAIRRASEMSGQTEGAAEMISLLTAAPA